MLRKYENFGGYQYVITNEFGKFNKFLFSHIWMTDIR